MTTILTETLFGSRPKLPRTGSLAAEMPLCYEACLWAYTFSSSAKCFYCISTLKQEQIMHLSGTIFSSGFSFGALMNFLAVGRCVWDWVKINSRVCDHSNEKTRQPVQQCDSLNSRAKSSEESDTSDTAHVGGNSLLVMGPHMDFVVL